MNYSTPEIVKSQRNIGLDIIRCFALLMIITVHTWSLSKIGDRFPYIQNAYVAFFRLGVPLFVMISGALQLSFKDMSIGKYYKKVFSRLLIPFLLWAAIVYIISCCIGKYSDVNSVIDAIVCFFPKMFENGVNMAYWYVQMIIVLYLLTPFLQRAIATITKKELLGVIIGLLVVSVIKDLFPQVYLTQYFSKLLPYLLFYLLGYYLSIENVLNGLPKWIFVLLFLISTMYKIFIPSYTSVSLYVACGALFVLLSQISIPKRYSEGIIYISRSSYTIYLSHMILITPIYVYVLRFNEQCSSMVQCAVYPILVSFMVLFICTIGVFVATKLFNCKKIIGFH
ncbi:MAG: acyltransferase [Bacteroidales bacterium]|nr:acyltransferase [Candidatus Colimorpha onthohippi]